MGMFGFPITKSSLDKKANQKGLENWYANNRARLDKEVGKNCFGFDCVCLLKAILWGWNGNFKSAYGGATYLSNDVPDFGDGNAMSYCTGVSSDMSNLVAGEWLWMNGHVGVYVGNGLVVEATMAWTKNVLVSKLSDRKWLKHGKPKWLDFSSAEVPPKAIPTKTNNMYNKNVHEWQNASILEGFTFPKAGADGIWGSECRSVAGKSVMTKALVSRKCNRVAWLQKILGSFYKGKVDGLFGSLTHQAVVNFQKSKGILVDGKAGPQTIEYLI
jgi:peptidoglycan hydrolase-like protein with peptidoglycan-binding domain